MENIVKAGTVFSLLFCSSIAGANNSTAAGCTGSVSKLWVEADDSLYFDIEPSTTCNCNHSVGNSKGFKATADLPNKDEQYAALLAAFMADKKVQTWYDWRSTDGSNRCISYNIALSK
ncbi:hypothetical protein ACJJIC_17430 [Microbulbifer sp. ANSA002]|uniref:hypothetical protein n=1 Tax=unclassified Microbulbifer TaxID=2619833 RepID=UPI004043821D